MTALNSNNQPLIYFLHGTSTNSRVLDQSVIKSIARLFGDKSNQGVIKLIDWSGANNTRARKNATENLLIEINNRKGLISSTQNITFVGHSHGGSIILYASSQLRGLIGRESQINILTLNTPNIVGGAKLEDPSINHYHVYCKSDKVAPRGGYNKTGILEKGGERKNWFGKPIGGEYSYSEDMGSGKEGSTNWKFESAILNVAYKDQYRFKGIIPRTHLVSHRGWLEKNVNQWLPKLKIQIGN